MALNATALLEEAVAKAKARFEAQQKEQAEKEAASKASAADAWKQKIRERELSERSARDKAALDITEDFLKEIAEPFERFARRDDAEKLTNIEVVLRPHKTGDSASFSMLIKCPGSNPRVWHRPSIESLTQLQRVQMDRLKEKGGFQSSSPVEMLEEIVRLRDYLMRIQAIVKNETGEAAEKVRDVLSIVQLPQD